MLATVALQKAAWLFCKDGCMKLPMGSLKEDQTVEKNTALLPALAYFSLGF